MNFQEMTAENIYLNLMTMPKKDWGKVIATLNDDRRNALLRLLRQKKGEKIDQPLPCKSLKDSSCEEKVVSPRASLTVCKEQSESSCKSPSHNEAMLETGLLSEPTIDAFSKPHDDEYKKVSPILIPLENIQDLMFVSGDSCSILHDSEIVLQRYIHVWFHLVLKSWSQVIFEENKKKNKTKMFEQVNLHDPLYYFEKVFSYEFSLYKEKVNFQNSARHTLWKPDADVNNSLVQKDVEHTRKGCNQSVIGEGSTSYREEGPVKFERSIFINHIEPYDRFTKRLKTQDLRTQQMNTLEYQRFSKAREGVSRTFRTSFHAWLRTTIKNHMQSYDFECSSSPPQLSGCNSQFLLFLVTDRLASLVELAYRLRYFNETLALRLEAKPFVLCEEWFTSSFSRLQQLYNSGNVMNDVSTILLQNEGTIDKNPLEPIYYQHAIALYLNAVDPNQLKLPFQTCIQCFLESFDLCLLNDGTKRKRKYKNPGSLSYQNENRKKKLNQPIRGNEPCETLPGDLNDSCHDSTSGMNQFFDRLIGQISEKRSSTLKLPEKLVVFAFLKCRDIFWKYRHETLTTIWNAVYERFRNQARSVSKDFEQFLQAYNKIIYSIEKMNDILIFESYFKDFFNIHNTLEIFLSNEKNEKSCIQMNTSCDALEKNCV